MTAAIVLWSERAAWSRIARVESVAERAIAVVWLRNGCAGAALAWSSKRTCAVGCRSAKTTVAVVVLWTSTLWACGW